MHRWHSQLSGKSLSNTAGVDECHLWPWSKGHENEKTLHVFLIVFGYAPIRSHRRQTITTEWSLRRSSGHYYESPGQCILTLWNPRLGYIIFTLYTPTERHHAISGVHRFTCLMRLSKCTSKCPPPYTYETMAKDISSICFWQSLGDYREVAAVAAEESFAEAWCGCVGCLGLWQDAVWRWPRSSLTHRWSGGAELLGVE